VVGAVIMGISEEEEQTGDIPTSRAGTILYLLIMYFFHT
jgi:hypothetical protein